MMMISRLRAINKGCRNKETDANAAIELFLHEAEKLGCICFAEVVEAIKEYFRFRGYNSFNVRYHIDWRNFSTAFAWEHRPLLGSIVFQVGMVSENIVPTPSPSISLHLLRRPDCPYKKNTHQVR